MEHNNKDNLKGEQEELKRLEEEQRESDRRVREAQRIIKEAMVALAAAEGKEPENPDYSTQFKTSPIPPAPSPEIFNKKKDNPADSAPKMTKEEAGGILQKNETRRKTLFEELRQIRGESDKAPTTINDVMKRNKVLRKFLKKAVPIIISTRKNPSTFDILHAAREGQYEGAGSLIREFDKEKIELALIEELNKVAQERPVREKSPKEIEREKEIVEELERLEKEDEEARAALGGEKAGRIKRFMKGLSPKSLIDNLRETLRGQDKNPTPETPEEKKIEKEIQKLPEEEKAKMHIGLSTLGFVVEKKKNDFFASTFDKISKIKEGSTISRFSRELRDSFIRDSQDAQKKAEEIANGKGKYRFKNAGLLVGNVVRYGRMLTDLTGALLASPLRYVMMGGMIFTRASEAGKETRLKNEKVIEKTRITDADRAAEEAWAIYEQAGGKPGSETETVSAEALKNAYLMNMPEEIYRRLENPSTANSFIQKILKADIQVKMNIIVNRIDSINNNQKLSLIEKKEKVEKLTRKYEKKLRDYDRILTQYGTVDELAMAGRYAQTLGKAVVAAVTVETLILSAEKLIGALSHALSSSDTHEVVTSSTPSPSPRSIASPSPTEAPTASPSPKVIPSASSSPTATPAASPDATAPVPGGKSAAGAAAEAAKQNPPALDNVIPNVAGEGVTFDHGKGGIQGILDLREQMRVKYPDINQAPEGIRKFMEGSAVEKAQELGFFKPGDTNESALILKGSVLKFDDKGNLFFGKPDASGNIPAFERFQGKMIDTDHGTRVIQHPAVDQAPKAPVDAAPDAGDTPDTKTSAPKVAPVEPNIGTVETRTPSTEEVPAATPAPTAEPTPKAPTPDELRAVELKKEIEAKMATGDTGNAAARLTGTPFEKETFGLTPEKASKVNDVYQKLFTGRDADIWNEVKDASAIDMVGAEPLPGTKEYSAVSHFNKVVELSGTKPQPGVRALGIPPEKVTRFMARAYAEIEKKGQLDKVKE